jgi:hypothetical protein
MGTHCLLLFGYIGIGLIGLVGILVAEKTGARPMKQLNGKL